MLHMISFECDTCEEVLDTETHDFREAVEHLKSEGWTAFQVSSGVWNHKCPECRFENE